MRLLRAQGRMRFITVPTHVFDHIEMEIRKEQALKNTVAWYNEDHFEFIMGGMLAGIRRAKG